MKILIVEDNEDSRNLLAEIVRAYGHEAITTADGAEALEQALVQPPDMVVSDILMPNMDGYQLCQKWKQSDKLRDIPFVFYTATYTSDEDERFALILGASAFIRKPTEPDAFVQILTEIFEKAESGALPLAEVAPLEPALFVSEYTKRVAAKLEQKVAELKTEITGHKQAKEELRKSEGNLRLYMESAPDGVYINDLRGTFLYGNKRTEELTGYPREELIGKSFLNLNLLAKKDMIKAGKALALSIAGKSTGPDEFELLRKDGSHIRVEINTVPLKEASGKKVVVGFVRDITEREQAEEILRESEEKFRILFENMLDGFAYCRIIVDENNQPVDFVYLEINDAFEKLTGLRRENVVGRKVTEAIPGTKEANPELLDIYGKVASTGEPIRFEIFFKPLEIWLDLSVYSPKKGYFVAVFENITERKQAEEELKQSRQQSRNLSAHLQSVREEERTVISREIHDELGQALTALKIDLFWLDKRLPEGQEPLNDKIRRMLQITDDSIKTVKRISTILRPGVLDDLGIVEAIEWQAKEFQGHTGIECILNMEVGDIHPDREIDTTVFRIFQETLTNVSRHANATRVSARLEMKANELVLQVRDNGKGISEEQISNPKSFGLLGMKERAISCGGNVAIQGIRDKGTTVILTIPLNIGEAR